MITYVDTSTLLKLLIDEPGSNKAEVIWDSADQLAAASLVAVEARAALAAARRGRRLTAAQHRQAKSDLALLLDAVNVVEVIGALVDDAAELAEQDALRGYDAVHLTAALTVGAQVVTSADQGLCEAAERHGLFVANPLE